MNRPSVSRYALAALRSLQADWNGHGAKPVTEAAMAVAENLTVVPTSSGGIQIEWHVNGQDVEIEVLNDGHIDPDGVLVVHHLPTADSE